jgi:hypothetical protein
MLCAFCYQESAAFGWDESSHLGRRPICHHCIGRRDQARLNENKSIILYLKGNLKGQKLVNQVRTLAFKIIEQTKANGVHRFYFLVNKKRWEGVMYPGLSNRVMCSRYKRGL